MDWAGLDFVFSTFVCMIYGWLSFIALTLSIAVISYFNETIQKFVKPRLSKDGHKGLLHNKHVIVTGGSSGIGRSLAILAAAEGANVSLVARNPQRLALAREDVLQACRDKSSQRIECATLDVSRDYEHVAEQFEDLEARQGVCYMLFNCAGTAICGKIEDTNEDAVAMLTQLNLLGTYYCTKAVVPKMKQARRGKIVLVGSQGSLLGIFGFTAYSATKFAVRGLAEALAMELKPHNISVTLSLPPDTDTPGFAAEEESKPLETKLICETGGLVQPDDVAKQIFEDAMDGKFFSTIGFISFYVTTLCAGMSPYSSFSELMLQVALMGPFRLISAGFLFSFDRIIRKCMHEREKQKKSE